MKEVSTKIVNLDNLILRTKDNPEVLMEMITVYREETPRFVTAMKQGVEKRDWESIRNGAHSIIPSFFLMGMNSEYEAMARAIMEFANRKERLPLIGELVSKIENACERAYAELAEKAVELQKAV